MKPLSGIDQLAVVVGLSAGIATFFIRMIWARHKGAQEHIGWSIASAISGAGLVKGSHPMWCLFFGCAEISDLWLYVYAGGLAVVFGSVVAILEALGDPWKSSHGSGK